VRKKRRGKRREKGNEGEEREGRREGRRKCDLREEGCLLALRGDGRSYPAGMEG